jgi:hypothetical protein
MSDQTFLSMMIDRAETVVDLRRRGRKRKAWTEYHAIYRDIDFYCRGSGADIAMYEKIMLYHLEERPAFQTQVRRKNTKRQRSKRRNANATRNII